MKNLTLAELATITGGELHGDGTITVSAVAPMDKAQEGNITFLSNVKYSKHLGDCKASAIMVKETERELCKTNVIVVNDPYVAFAKVAQALDTTPAPAAAIADSASISGDATIGQNVSIGANAVIESGVVLGDDVVIGAGAGERRALHVHMAQLTIVGGRGQSKTVEVVIVAGTLNPKVTLDGVDHIVEEAWCNLVLDVNALVVAHCIGIAAAVRGDGRPCADDAVATRADAVHDGVIVVESCGRKVTIVVVRGQRRSRVARVEVHVAEAVHAERDVSRCIHRDLSS